MVSPALAALTAAWIEVKVAPGQARLSSTTRVAGTVRSSSTSSRGRLRGARGNRPAPRERPAGRRKNFRRVCRTMVQLLYGGQGRRPRFRGSRARGSPGLVREASGRTRRHWVQAGRPCQLGCSGRVTVVTPTPCQRGRGGGDPCGLVGRQFRQSRD